MYTPEKETAIRRAAQADRIRGAEALFRNRKKPDVDIKSAVQRSVTSAVKSTMAGRSLSPDQFPSPSRSQPLTSRLAEKSVRKPSEVVKRSKIQMSTGRSSPSKQRGSN